MKYSKNTYIIDVQFFEFVELNIQLQWIKLTIRICNFGVKETKKKP